MGRWGTVSVFGGSSDVFCLFVVREITFWFYVGGEVFRAVEFKFLALVTV